MAAANNKSLDYCVKNLTQCPICLSDVSNPTSLPCLHTFCMNCLQTMCENLDGDNLNCPVCRKCCPISQSGAGGFQHNFFIQSLLEAKSCSEAATNQPMCDVCSNVDGQGAASANVPEATVFCVNCSQKLCNRCSAPHKRMPGGSHQIKQLGDGFESDFVRLRANYCRQHKDELVKLYCFQCQVDMCWMCAAVQHRNHDCKEISHVAEDFKKRINDLTGKVSTKADEVQKQLKLIDVEKVKFLSSSDAADKLIKKTGEDMKQLIDAQVSKLLNELAAGKVEELKKFEDKRNSYELALIALESFNTYACELTAKGSSSDIVRASKELETRANELIKAKVANYQGTIVTFTPVSTKVENSLIGKITKQSPYPPIPSRDDLCGEEVLTGESDYDEEIQDEEKIISPPSAPVDVERQFQYILWKQPLNDGGSPVTTYAIESLNAAGQWSLIRRVLVDRVDGRPTQSLQSIYYKIPIPQSPPPPPASLFLRTQSPYCPELYRVRASNVAGYGPPSEEV